MNVDTLLHQYFPQAGNACIELFDDQNIQQVYRRLVEVLIHQPEVETSLLQAMSYCFYEVMDNVLIHSGKTVGIVITNYSEAEHLIQILVADDGMGIHESLAKNSNYSTLFERIREIVKEKQEGYIEFMSEIRDFTLELKTEDKKIIITKSIKKTISLEERFKAYNGKNLAKDFEWDEPQGREIW